MRDPRSVSCVFNPTNRTLDFSGEPGFDIRILKGVFHLPTGRLIYFPGLSAIGYSQVTGSVVTLEFNTAGMLANDPLLCILDDGLNGGASAAKQDAQQALLQDIKTILGNQRAQTLWTDNSGKFYIRQDNGQGNITWTDISGNPSSPPGTGARPESDGATVVAQTMYRATANGTGYSNNDILYHITVTDNAAGALVGSFWLNITSNARINAPDASQITPLSPLPDGASTAANQTAANQLLSELATGIGDPSDGDPGADTSPGTLLAKLTRLLVQTTGLGSLLTDIKARLPASLSSGRLAVDGSGVTQPIGGVGNMGATPSVAAVQIAAVDAANKKRPVLVNGDGAVTVATPMPGGVVTGQVKIATTGTPVQLPTNALRNGIVIKASVANAPQVTTPGATFSAMVGAAGVVTQYDGTGNGYPLSPGEAASFACDDASRVWVNGAAGDVFSYEGN